MFGALACSVELDCDLTHKDRLEPVDSPDPITSESTSYFASIRLILTAPEAVWDSSPLNTRHLEERSKTMRFFSGMIRKPESTDAVKFPRIANTV